MESSSVYMWKSAALLEKQIVCSCHSFRFIAFLNISSALFTIGILFALHDHTVTVYTYSIPIYFLCHVFTIAIVKRMKEKQQQQIQMNKSEKRIKKNCI